VDPSWEPYQEAVARRESRADVASLRHVFRPDSLAVVGASRRTGTVGRAILHNIVTGGYQGKVYAVNPHATRMEGVLCLPSVSTLPGPVDLAVIAVPDLAALREILLRVSRLADDLPEVAELDLNPVLTRPDGVSASGARIRLAPAQPHDPFLRKLR
jgi:hypothetical protein